MAAVHAIAGFRATTDAVSPKAMTEFDPNELPSAWGTFEDAEALRRWSFMRRTPEQRLNWLVAALELANQSGAITFRGSQIPDASAGKSSEFLGDRKRCCGDVVERVFASELAGLFW